MSIERMVQRRFDIIKQAYIEAEKDGMECEKELKRILYFMSMRIDISGDKTVLESYESMDKDLIDRMMNGEY